MPIDLEGSGEDNIIDVPDWFYKYGRLKVQFLGKGASLKIAGIPRSCTNMIIQLGSGSSVSIGEGCGLSNTYIYTKSDGHIQIGRDSTFTTRVRIIMHEPSRVCIGNDCMIASDVQFMTSDVHTIFSTTSGRRLNYPKDIIIGDHVWIALQTFIMKGTSIGSGSVIGLRSVVTSSIPACCLAVGSPARVVRQGISWDRKLWTAEEDIPQGLSLT
jgi:acetyltransferase-like isoleucine patch superfamily enzyme